MTNKTLLYGVLAVMSALLSLTMLNSCNKDDDKDTVETYSTSAQTTLIKAFGLQADSEVLASLDSVYFTVDYDNGLIYNADSLPVGTDISALKVKIDFFNTVNSAVFNISGATAQSDTAITYTSSMNDALDFTGKTILTVTSYDKTRVKDYQVKVLVHKENPDSLKWSQSWRRDLPGLTSRTKAFKVVRQGDMYRAMSYDGSACYLMTSSSPTGSWSSGQANVPFEPQVASLEATADALYMLDSAGGLWTSADGMQWNATGVKWHSILGAYGTRLLGIAHDGSAYLHDEYPRSEDFEPVAVEDGFPVAHASDMIVTDNTWTVSQQAIIVGGVDANGHSLSDVWGYDGSTWGKINNTSSSVLPALTDATLFPYYTYKSLPGIRRYARQSTWYVMGGKLADGSLNGNIYLSSTQGITWSVGDSTMAQPSFIPRFYGAQAMVSNETLNVGGAAGAPRRVQALVTSWDCPYIYLFGGYNDRGELLPSVWRGVYNRLTNTPVY
jgi:hypothetical protein